MVEKKKIRLGAAAREFNVGQSTIVEFLQKKGHPIDDSGNAKLTDEMYEILVKNFGDEKKEKEEAQKLNMDFSNKSATSAKTEEEPVEEEPVEELLIKNTTLIENEHIVTSINKPKIVGKIDLEAQSPKKKTVSKGKEEAATKKAETTTDKQEDKSAASEDTTAATPEVEKKPETKTETVKEKPVPEHIGIVVEKNEGPKILRTIDLEAAGKPKHTEQPQPDAEPAIIELQESVEEKEVATPAHPEPERIEVKVETLTGPKVLGKIELPVEHKSVKSNEKKDANKKEVTNPKKAERKGEKRKRTYTQNTAKPVKSNNENNAAKKVEKVEISQEDIDRQIKETQLRMAPHGKSAGSKHKRDKRQQRQAEHLEQERQELEQQKILKVTEFITANELATLMNVPVNQIIKTCMDVGLFVAINQRLGAETIALLTEEFGYQVEFVNIDDEHTEHAEEDAPEDLQPRHPIITVMGHVDHGKTSLLDYIRKSNVIAGEAGGITQHIGAYEVQLADGRKITFLDTPGHEAFTAMRARGAKITDVCIIVIAADDAIMPQTVEAINHAQAAGVPMVFAITKIDKPQANPDKIREGLANMNILVEEWGGKYQCQEIDAKHGTNVNELLEKVLLEAELLDLKANPNRLGIGTVIESSLDKGKGYVAKLLVQNGTLKVGDPIQAGSFYGKVKALFNERNQRVQSVGPASPVLLLGLNGAPQAGDTFKVCESEQDAKSIATKRASLLREQGLRTQVHVTLDEIGRRIAIGDFKELNIIVKGDVDGSVEALADSLMKLTTEQVQVNVIHKSVGQVTESDVLLASASNAIIVAFQVRPSVGARKLAEKEQIDLRTYSIIYDAINEIKDAIECMLTPKVREKILCNIEIREVFKITKVGNVAGCVVLDGKIQRNTKIRLIRDGIVIYTGKLGSLRRFKDDVKEVVTGQDCGLNIENFNDIKVGDIIEGYEEYEEKATL